jgi:hypothetical protein
MAVLTTWYATSRLGPDARNNPTWANRPDAALIHAKRIGTSLTACGRDTATWHKYWLPFEPNRSTGVCCSECIGALAGSRTPS